MRTSRVQGLNRGMKLFPAPDKSDAPLVLENIDPAANSNLVTRMGVASLGYTIPGGEVHSIAVRRGVAANRYYVSGAGGLYRDGATLIASGFGANEFVQTANVANNIWFMNRTKAVRDDGATVRDWLPATPGAALTAALQTRVLKSIADFATDNTWQLIDASGTPGASAAITYAAEAPGTVVRHAIPGATRFETVLSGITRDLSLESEQRASDTVRISIRVDSPEFLTSIELFLGAGFVDPEDNYYSVIIPASVFAASPGQWVALDIRRGAPDGDPIDPPLYFRRNGTTASQSWATISSLYIVTTTTAATEVAFGQWEIFGGVSGPLKGDYEYFYTHVDDAEGETNPSPALAIAVANQPVLLTLPAAPAGVAKRHIYRGGGTQSGTFRVHTLNAGTNTVTDTTPEDIAVRLGRVMEEDHDPAPMGRGVAFGEGRLCVFSSADKRNMAIVSKAGPGYSYFPTTNELLIGDDDEDILAAHFRGDSWIFWKERSIHRVDGNWPGRPIKTSARHGILGVNAVCEAGGESGGLFFYASDDGIYSFNMDFGRKLSQDLDPLFRGQSVDLGNISIPPLNTDPAARSRCVLSWCRDRLIFAYPSAGESQPTGALVYHLPSERWSFMRLAAGRHIRSMFFEGTGGDFLIGGGVGEVWADNDGFSDAGSPIAWIYQSPYMDLGVADLGKTIQDLMIRCNMRGGTATVKLYVNDGADDFALGSLTGSTWTEHVFQTLETGTALAKALGNECRNFSIRLEGTTAGARAEVSEFAFRFEVQAREAEDFDSQWMTFGTSDAKELRALRFDVENPISMEWSVQSDVSQATTPTPGMAQRDAGTLTETGGRRMVTIPVQSITEGHQMRLLLAGRFRLWAAWAYVRTLGFFVSTLDAARGFFWESQPIRFPFVAEVRRLKLTYRSQDTLSMIFSEDYPGAQAATAAVTFPAAASETVKLVDKPMTLRTGKLNVSSPKQFRLYEMSMEVKPIAMLYGAGEGGGYDSGWSDYGTQKLKQFESLRFDIVNAATATVTISRDGAADLVLTVAAGARRPIILDLGNFRAKQIRIQVTSAGEFSIFGGEVWMIPFGRVVEAGAPFQPDFILIPQGAIALFSEIQVDADCVGDVTVAILTDQPGGGAPVSRFSQAKTFAGRAEKVWRLPDGIRGGLWTIQVSVAGQTIVRAVKVRMKILGQAGRTDWVWANIPVEATPPLARGVDMGIVGDQAWREVPIPIEGGQQGPFQWVPIPVDAIE